MLQKNVTISPKQPYFVLSTSKYYKMVMMNYGISHFYCFFNDDAMGSTIMAVPDGCIDILFCCDDKEPKASLCGTVLHLTNANILPNKYYFGVRFLPGMAMTFQNISMADVIDNQIPLLQVIKEKDLFEKITTSRNFHQQIQTFLEVYLRIYEESKNLDKYHDLKEYMIRRIHETTGQIKIQQLSTETNYSVRYINKIFSNEFGMAPKTFCKLMRFQKLLGQLNEFDLNSDEKNLAELASELGYFDQSHMMKDFLELSSTTPGKYLHFLKETDYKNRIVLLKEMGIHS